MKLSDITFKENVTFSAMLEMASKLVDSMFKEPDKRVSMMIGEEYLYLQAATRLFTNYGAIDGVDDIEAFMEMVFSFGVDRYEEWLGERAGAEKYKAFKRMVERGIKYYLDMGPLEMLVGEAGVAVHRLNQMINEGGELTTERAIELLKMYVAEQGEPPQE